MALTLAYMRIWLEGQCSVPTSLSCRAYVCRNHATAEVPCLMLAARCLGCTGFVTSKLVDAVSFTVVAVSTVLACCMKQHEAAVRNPCMPLHCITAQM